jgi:hypothetical protein
MLLAVTWKSGHFGVPHSAQLEPCPFRLFLSSDFSFQEQTQGPSTRAKKRSLGMTVQVVLRPSAEALGYFRASLLQCQVARPSK